MLSVLRAAARAATSRGEPGAAARYLSRALREPLPEYDRALVLAELGCAEAGAHPAAAVRHLTEALGSLTDQAPQRLRVVSVLADALVRCRRGCQAAELLDREARALDPAEPSRRHLAVQLTVQRLLTDLDDPAQRPHLARAAAELVTASPGEPEAARAVEAVRATLALGTGADAGAVAAQARRALAGDLPQGLTTIAVEPAVLALIWCDRPQEAAEFTGRLTADAAWDRSPSARILASLSRCDIAYRAGDLGTAIDAGRDCLGLLAGSRGDSRLALATAAQVRALTDAAHTDEAAQLLALPACSRLEPDWRWTHLLEARARLSLARGHLNDALRDLLECGRRQTAWRRDNPAVLPWRSLAAHTYLALGSHGPAQRLAEEELEQARAFGAPRALGLSLRAAGLTARGRRGQHLLEESIGLLDQAGATVEQARSLIDLATLRFAAGHTRLARELAYRGLHLARRCAAATLGTYALGRLRDFGARPRGGCAVGVHALTAGERRVAALAVGGLTNREIAQELFITRRTVENHLTNGFRKLGITGRRQLPELAQSLDLHP